MTKGRFSYFLNACLVILGALNFPVQVQTQTRTLITGTVVEEDGTPLSHANVFLIGTTEGGVTDNNGRFSFTTTKQGEVQLTASVVGYSRFTQRLLLRSGSPITIDVQLKRNVLTSNEVVVTASGYSSEKGKGMVVSRMDVITTPGGAADIFQAIKTLPGLTQVSESAELHIRGGNPTETATILDQATLYHPYTFESSFGGIFSNINTNSMRGMYFSSGGFSAKYGNALSGVLDIDTKDEPTLRKVAIGLSLVSASLGTEIPLHEDRLGFRLEARQSYTRPMFLVNGGVDLFTATPTSGDVQGGLTYRYSSTGRLKLFGLYAGDDQGVHVTLAGLSDVFTGRSKNSLLNLQLRDVFADVLVKASLSRNRYSSSWDLGILDLTRTDDVLNARIDAEYQLRSNTKLLAGVEGRYRRAAFEGVIPSENYNLRTSAPFTVIDERFGGYHFACYGEIELTRLFGSRHLFAVGGGRLDYLPTINLHWIDPRASIGWRIDDQSTVKFGWGLFRQHPDPRYFSPTDGNPSLEAMQAMHYNLSYDHHYDRFFDFRAELYSKTYSRLPLNHPVLKYVSSGYGFARGFDLMAKGTLPGIGTGWITYGYISTKRHWMDWKDIAPSSYDITHNMTIVLTHDVTPEWKVGINYKLASGRPFTPVVGSTYLPDQGVYKPLYGATNSTRMKTYTRLDLRLTHLTAVLNNFTVFYLEGLNILNIQNVAGYTYSSDYSERKSIRSYFGRRMVVFGGIMTL